MIDTTLPSPNFFEEGSPFLKHPLLTAERTTQEIDFIEDNLGLESGARILDVGCGFGRHSIELASRGYDVTGIDPSLAMIAEARNRAAEVGQTIDFHQERGERFICAQLYDAAICLFTTYGQITEQGDNTALARQVHAALKTGAYFVIEVPQRDVSVRQLKLQEELGTGERKAIIKRSYDAAEQVVTEEFRIVSDSGERTYLLKYRLFTRMQLETQLKEAGFIEISAYGDYKGTSLNAEHAAMVMVARKGN